MSVFVLLFPLSFSHLVLLCLCLLLLTILNHFIFFHAHANKQSLAQQAVKLVRIDYEEHVPILTIEQAIAHSSFYVTDRRIERVCFVAVLLVCCCLLFVVAENKREKRAEEKEGAKRERGSSCGGFVVCCCCCCCCLFSLSAFCVHSSCCVAVSPKGDVESGFAAADHVLEGEVRMGGQEHFYLETQCCIAVPKGEAQEMEIISSTQNVTKTQFTVASVLRVPANRVVCKVKRMGGGFGGKETRSACCVSA